MLVEEPAVVLVVVLVELLLVLVDELLVVVVTLLDVLTVVLLVVLVELLLVLVELVLVDVLLVVVVLLVDELVVVVTAGPQVSENVPLPETRLMKRYPVSVTLGVKLIASSVPRPAVVLEARMTGLPLASGVPL